MNMTIGFYFLFSTHSLMKTSNIAVDSIIKKSKLFRVLRRYLYSLYTTEEIGNFRGGGGVGQ